MTKAGAHDAPETQFFSFSAVYLDFCPFICFSVCILAGCLSLTFFIFRIYTFCVIIICIAGYWCSDFNDDQEMINDPVTLTLTLKIKVIDLVTLILTLKRKVSDTLNLALTLKIKVSDLNFDP